MAASSSDPASTAQLKLVINVVGLDGNEQDIIMPAHVDWFNGKDLMKEVAARWGIPYGSICLTVIGSDVIVNPKLTFRELGIEDGTVVQLIRQITGPGSEEKRLEDWERECCICGDRMSQHVWAIIPSCRGCYIRHKERVDRFKREQQH